MESQLPLIYLLFLCILILFVFFIYYLKKNQKSPQLQPFEKAVFRNATAWKKKLQILEEYYGKLSREIVFTHYIDDISDNVFLFNKTQTALIMNQAFSYDRIEKCIFEYSGVYVLKIWIKQLPEHYITLSSFNAKAMYDLKQTLEHL